MNIVCPLHMDPEAQDGCYRWREFEADFIEQWSKHFDAPPTLAHWRSARRDWRRASTGWEAVQIAVSRAREKARKAAEPPPIHIIGRRYALSQQTADGLRKLIAPKDTPPDQAQTSGRG